MKRTIEISTRGLQVYLKAKRLVIQKDEEELARIPIQDIGLVVLATDGIGLSSGSLQALSMAGVAVLFCDTKHLPQGLLLPTVGNCLHVERLGRQASCKEPIKKNLWKRVVQAKIKNQCALVQEDAIARRLQQLAKTLKSGDANNHEAQAAQLYWPRVFVEVLPANEGPFRRRRAGDGPNALLNYGYAILRAATARAIVGAGLHPGLGIHHHNRYSNYPLADDLMEAFRPWIDASVKSLLSVGQSTLTPESKAQLLSTLTHPVLLPQGETPLSTALDRCSQTMAKALEAAEDGLPADEASKLMELPRFLPTE